MTARHEKPSPHESSTDTIIESLGIIANLLDHYDVTGIEGQVAREAASRLNDLECELFQLRGEK